MEVRLYSKGLEDKIHDAERNLTVVLDQLNLLESEADRIRFFWDSPSYREWRRELERQTGMAAVSVRRLSRLLLAMNEIAVMLAETEKNNETAVSQL